MANSRIISNQYKKFMKLANFPEYPSFNNNLTQSYPVQNLTKLPLNQPVTVDYQQKLLSPASINQQPTKFHLNQPLSGRPLSSEAKIAQSYSLSLKNFHDKYGDFIGPILQNFGVQLPTLTWRNADDVNTLITYLEQSYDLLGRASIIMNGLKDNLTLGYFIGSNRNSKLSSKYRKFMAIFNKE